MCARACPGPASVRRRAGGSVRTTPVAVVRQPPVGGRCASSTAGRRGPLSPGRRGRRHRPMPLLPAAALLALGDVPIASRRPRLRRGPPAGSLPAATARPWSCAPSRRRRPRRPGCPATAGVDLASPPGRGRARRRSPGVVTFAGAGRAARRWWWSTTVAACGRTFEPVQPAAGGRVVRPATSWASLSAWCAAPRRGRGLAGWAATAAAALPALGDAAGRRLRRPARAHRLGPRCADGPAAAADGTPPVPAA